MLHVNAPSDPPAVCSLLDSEKMRMWARTLSGRLSFAPGLAALTFHSTKAPRPSADLFLSPFSLSTWEETPNHHRVRTSLEFITLQTRKNDDRESKTLKPSRLSSETASGHSVNDQGNASIVQLTKRNRGLVLAIDPIINGADGFTRVVNWLFSSLHSLVSWWFHTSTLICPFPCMSDCMFVCLFVC